MYAINTANTITLFFKAVAEDIPLVPVFKIIGFVVAFKLFLVLF